VSDAANDEGSSTFGKHWFHEPHLWWVWLAFGVGLEVLPILRYVGRSTTVHMGVSRFFLSAVYQLLLVGSSFFRAGALFTASRRNRQMPNFLLGERPDRRRRG
jgi:hypothetical protein